MDLAKIGVWAFILGLIIALLAAFVEMDATLTTSLLVVLGVIVGFLNITDKEVNNFIMVTVALALVSYIGGTGPLVAVPTIGPMIAEVLHNFIVFVMPAVIIVAVKAIYNIAKD